MRGLQDVVVVVLNVAVTLRLVVIETVQLVAVPLQLPDQPPKVEPEAVLAVRVTEVPLAKLALQVLPQLIPAGLLVTVPLPVPVLETVRE
ncbi:MAG: hypothetical protein HYZ92_06975 [Candidatus Omnitrophica bacterium]|nr:hypothetical protein [Candidatus Omnitrophota bacterium]